MTSRETGSKINKRPLQRVEKTFKKRFFSRQQFLA